MSCRECGNPATHTIYPERRFCDPCGAAFDEDLTRRLEENRRRRKAARRAARGAARAARERSGAPAQGSSLLVHLRPLKGYEPAACGCYGERYTEDPEEVTCRKCAPAASKRPGPLPTEPILRAIAVQALEAM